ncbi:MAG: DUF4268 domain-containing protein, partial [Candidatus Kapaibacterium sp.]
HLMPQSWEANWPPPDDDAGARRNELLHTIGTLTLVTQALNSKVSNGPWDLKSAELNKHGVVLMNTRLPEFGADPWTDASIEKRTQACIDVILELWSVPEGHEIRTVEEEDSSGALITIADLVRAGLLKPGTELVFTVRGYEDARAVVTDEGNILCQGRTFTSPTGAGRLVLGGRSNNGWIVWAVNDGKQTLLRSYKRAYMLMRERAMTDATSGDVDDLIAEAEEMKSGMAAVWLEYWQGFREYLDEAESALSVQRPQAANWIISNIGRANIWMSLNVWSYSPLLEVSRPGIGVTLVTTRPEWYAALLAKRDIIEAELGERLDWESSEGMRSQYIILRSLHDPTNPDEHQQCYEWHMRTLQRMRDVFVPLVREL